jgi:hypothetical protein
MKMLVIDIDKFEDFLFVLRESQAVLWVDKAAHASMDKLIIIPPTSPFPAMYCHFSEPNAWQGSITDHFKVIFASINDE